MGGERTFVSSSLPQIPPAQLKYLALNGRRVRVYRYYAALPFEQGPLYQDPHILVSAIEGAIEVSAQGRIREGTIAPDVVGFVDRTLHALRGCFDEAGASLDGYYRACRTWAQHLAEAEEFSLVAHAARSALDNGVPEFSAIGIALRVVLSESLVELGQTEDGRSVLGNLPRRPYLVEDRALLARIAILDARFAISAGRSHAYNRLIWRALRLFHTDDVLRIETVEKVARAYGGKLAPLRASDTTWWPKLIYAAALLYSASGNFRILRMLRVTRFARLLQLALCYTANYGHPTAQHENWVEDAGRQHDRTGSKNRPGQGILVTRAMGGIGDLLMMTPGLRALRRKFPNERIDFAVPLAFHSLFEGNPDFNVIDIQGADIDLAEYRSWFNLTDCPAARVETRMAPRVTRNRIEIFASALGITAGELAEAGQRPAYFVTSTEAEAATELLSGFRHRPKLIGVQLRSAEPYRDYRHIAALVDRLSADYDLILFDAKEIVGFDRKGIFKCDRFPLRTSVALLAQCDILVGPDSSFIHFSGSLGLRALGIYGPIDGKVRTSDYPNCEFIDARRDLRCVPCWRNQGIMCGLTGAAESECLGNVSVEHVLSRIQNMLAST